MSSHYFDVDQTVVAIAFNIPFGPYQITRLLPLSHGIPYYHAKSVADAHERVLAENSIRLLRS